MHRLPVGAVTAGALSFVAISVYQGTFHALWWDRYIAPPHNKPEWNLRKVLLCHVPNLSLTLAFFGWYGDAAPFVACHALSLVIASVVMRFPRPAAQAHRDAASTAT